MNRLTAALNPNPDPLVGCIVGSLYVLALNIPRRETHIRERERERERQKRDRERAIKRHTMRNRDRGRDKGKD